MGLLSTLAGPVAGIASSALGFVGAERAGDRSETAAKNQYTWAVRDMRRAGLNPILAAKYGPAQIPTYPNAGAAAVQAGTSAYQAAKSGQLTDAKVGLTGAQEEQTEAQTELTKTQRQMVQRQVLHEAQKQRLTESEVQRVRNAADLLMAQYSAELSRAKVLRGEGRIKEVQAQLDEIMGDFYTRHPNIFLLKRTGAASAAAGGLKSVFRAAIGGWLLRR